MIHIKKVGKYQIIEVENVPELQCIHLAMVLKMAFIDLFDEEDLKYLIVDLEKIKCSSSSLIGIFLWGNKIFSVRGVEFGLININEEIIKAIENENLSGQIQILSKEVIYLNV